MIEFVLITSQTVNLLLLLLFEVTGVLGRLTASPKNNFALKGATTVFTCCSDVDKLLFWKVKSFGSSSSDTIFDFSGLVNGFFKSRRFSVHAGSRPGCSRLIITEVKPEDAGTYTCVENEGFGHEVGWEFVILGFFGCLEPTREAEYMGINNFGLPQDVINIICTTKYFGNIRLRPVCERPSGSEIFDNHQYYTEAKASTTLNIHIPATKDLNGDQIYCYVKIDEKSSDSQNTTVWKSPRFIINYASFHQCGVSQCSDDKLSLDCQPSCTYKTKQFSNGSFYCELAYPSHPHKIFHVPLQDTNQQVTEYVSSSANIPDECRAGYSGECLVIVTALSILSTCGLVAIIAITLWRKNCRRRKGNTHDRSSSLGLSLPNSANKI